MVRRRMLVVADRNRLDGGGIAALLERDGEFTVSAMAISAEETVRECRRHRPEVLVLTLSTPSGTVELTSFAIQHPAAFVLFATVGVALVAAGLVLFLIGLAFDGPR